MHETSNLPTEALRAPNPHPSSYPQSPRTPRDDAKFAVGKIRQNATQSDRIPHDATKTRARAHAREASPPVIPAKAGILVPARVPFLSRHGSDSTYRLGVAVP